MKYQSICLLKDNADDIKNKLNNRKTHEIIELVKEKAQGITQSFAYKGQIFFAEELSYDQLSERVDAVFIALHGRPGEDGTIQQSLEARNIPYNGSGVNSSKITINKHFTNQALKEKGLKVFHQYLPQKKSWLSDESKVIAQIEKEFDYPFIAKPVDDGCSSAVKVINNQLELKAFASLIFRDIPALPDDAANLLNIDSKEEVPQKTQFLIEEMVVQGDALKLIEITGGLITKGGGEMLEYEIFEPSEAVASKGIFEFGRKVSCR